MLFARYQSRLLVWLAPELIGRVYGAMTVQFIGGARSLETAAGIPYETGLLIYFGVISHSHIWRLAASRQRI